MRNVLIDASNLHIGGGVRVAASFINSLGRHHATLLSGHEWRFRILVSQAVQANLTPDVTRIPNAELIVRHRRWWSRPTLDKDFDLTFTVFGPRRRSTHGRAIQLIGLADPYLEHFPLGPNGRSLTSIQRVKHTLRSSSLRQPLTTVVERASYGRQLAAKWGIEDVVVVPNVPADSFRNLRGQIRSGYQIPTNEIRMLCPARGYRHKNLGDLVQLRKAFAKRGFRVTFLLTLTRRQFQSLPSELHSCSINLGYLSTENLQAAMRNVHAIVLPSIWEVFSAVPLEAIASGLPAIVRDLPSLREVYGDAVLYHSFEGNDTSSDAAIETLTRQESLETYFSKADNAIDAWPTEFHRSQSYIEIIDRLLSCGAIP